MILAGVAAALAGGLWTGVTFASMMAAFSGDSEYRSLPTFAFMLLWGSVFGATVAMALTWTVGLAWRAIACASSMRNAASYVGFGASVGALIGFVSILLLRAEDTAVALVFVLWLGSCGAVVALTGWLIRRPDREVANPDTRAA
jgi:hypothetical protein